MPAIGELLLGAWNIIKMGLSGVGKILGSLDGRGWLELIATIAAAAALAHFGLDARHWRKQDGQDVKALQAEKAAFAKTVADYRTIATKQKAADAAMNAATVNQQQSINQEQSDEFQARLAAARARYDSLSRTPPANPRSGSGTTVPVIPAATSGLDAATGQDGLPTDDQYLCTAQSIQLDELIKWAKAQHNVDPNEKPHVP